MTPREELIAALVTDKHSGFKEEDTALLEAASDARLEEFRAATDARKAEINSFNRLTVEHKNVTARLKVAEDRIRANDAPMNEEDFIAKAPASIKTLLEAKKAEDDATRASLVSQLKDCGADTEEQLKAMSLDQLKQLAAYARVTVPDFSGKATPKNRAAETTSYAPPNPYEPGLKALREAARS